MIKLISLIALTVLLMSIGLVHADNDFVVLPYHDVKDTVMDEARIDNAAVGSADLERQFEWIKQEGCEFISIDDLFNRTASQLETQAQVNPYAWMPVLAFQLKAPDSWFVRQTESSNFTGGYILDRLARVSDETLTQHYGYGLSKPGTFGYAANMASAAYAANSIQNGENSIEKIAEAIHDGWSSVARTYDDPQYKQNPAKQATRLKLASTPYAALSEEEKEKDRVVARALFLEATSLRVSKFGTFDKAFLSSHPSERLSPCNSEAK